MPVFYFMISYSHLTSSFFARFLISVVALRNRFLTPLKVLADELGASPSLSCSDSGKEDLALERRIPL